MTTPRAHHRHHRPGRQLPRRAAAGQGLRGDRHGAALEHRELRAHRPPPGPHRSSSPGDLLDEISMINVLRDHRPARGLQPRRPVLRADVVEPARAHRRDDRARRDPHARRHPHRRPRDPLLPGVSSTRCSARCRRSRRPRDDAVLPPLALRRGQGLRPLDHRELPRELRPPRQLSGILFNHEISPTCTPVSDPSAGLDRHRCRSADSHLDPRDGRAAAAASQLPRRRPRGLGRRALRAACWRAPPTGTTASRSSFMAAAASIESTPSHVHLTPMATSSRSASRLATASCSPSNRRTTLRTVLTR